MSDIETTLRRAASGLPADVPVVATRADAEGLVDVAYASVDSPLGPLLVAGTPKGLVRVAYTEFRAADDVLEDLARLISPRVLEAPARLDPVRRELEEYFGGARRSFDVPIDWSHLAGFTRAVLRETARIGFGDTSTYAAVAGGAGSPRAVRAAGNALGANPMPVVVPCHRVLRTGGALGGYTGGVERKEYLLRLEGARV
ncbi:MAG TPA: methylated-DNA--[protein]-cysteine S-methyltransferase [Thermoleophilaceae bacterium]|jgi:methylated-DNA-[protein]-cysteine S-methyltransferase|nr:methylated-DNA--[protein]-cysteine S-methyltransferase [Thermoleophilaceae bacterium]